MIHKDHKPHLIIPKQSLQIATFDKAASPLVTLIDSIIEVSQPEDRIVISYGPVAVKAEAVTDGVVVTVSLFDICKASCHVSGHEAERGVCVFHPNGDGTFIAGHAGETGL